MQSVVHHRKVSQCATCHHLVMLKIWEFFTMCYEIEMTYQVFLGATSQVPSMQLSPFMSNNFLTFLMSAISDRCIKPARLCTILINVANAGHYSPVFADPLEILQQ